MTRDCIARVLHAERRPERDLFVAQRFEFRPVEQVAHRRKDKGQCQQAAPALSAFSTVKLYYESIDGLRAFWGFSVGANDRGRTAKERFVGTRILDKPHVAPRSPECLYYTKPEASNLNP